MVGVVLEGKVLVQLVTQTIVHCAVKARLRVERGCGHSGWRPRLGSRRGTGRGHGGRLCLGPGCS